MTSETRGATPSKLDSNDHYRRGGGWHVSPSATDLKIENDSGGMLSRDAVAGKHVPQIAGEPESGRGGAADSEKS
jgi:hypothetical protein